MPRAGSPLYLKGTPLRADLRALPARHQEGPRARGRAYGDWQPLLARQDLAPDREQRRIPDARHRGAPGDSASRGCRQTRPRKEVRGMVVRAPASPPALRQGVWAGRPEALSQGEPSRERAPRTVGGDSYSRLRAATGTRGRRPPGPPAVNTESPRPLVTSGSSPGVSCAAAGATTR